MVSIFVCLSFIRADEVSAYKGFDVDIKGEVYTSYDDNVTSKNNKTEDWLTNFLVGIGLNQEGKKHLLNLFASIKQQFFFDNDSYNNTAESFSVDFQRELSKYDSIKLSNVFEHSEEPTSFEDNFGRTSGRYSYYKNKFDIEYSRSLSKQLAFQTRYSYENYNVSERNYRDSNLNSIGLELDYFKNSSTGLMMGYSCSRRYFDSGESAYLNILQTGVTHYFTKQLYFDARTGISWIDDFLGEHQTDPYLYLGLTDNIDENTMVNVSYRQDNSTKSYEQDIFDSWQLSVNFARQIFERLNAAVSFFCGEGDFVSTSISDAIIGFSAKLNYSLSEYRSAFFRYIYSETDSNLNSRDYDRNIIEFGFTFKF